MFTDGPFQKNANASQAGKKRLATPRPIGNQLSSLSSSDYLDLEPLATGFWDYVSPRISAFLCVLRPDNFSIANEKVQKVAKAAYFAQKPEASVCATPSTKNGRRRIYSMCVSFKGVNQVKLYFMLVTTERRGSESVLQTCLEGG
jgi:hypothetical protein